MSLQSQRRQRTLLVSSSQRPVRADLVVLTEPACGDAQAGQVRVEHRGRVLGHQVEMRSSPVLADRAACLGTPDGIRTRATALRVPPRSKWRRLEINERAGQRRFSTSGVVGCRRPISVLVLPQRCPAPSSGRHSACPGHPVARATHPTHGRRAMVSQSVRNPSDGPILQHLFRTRILRRFCANERGLTGFEHTGRRAKVSSLGT
jgi:hypothetical protein